MTTTAPVQVDDKPPTPARPRGRMRRAYDRSWFAWAMVIPTVVVATARE